MRTEWLQTIGNGILDILYPPCCLVCGVRLTEGAMCLPCQKDMHPILPPYCDRCGVPIAGESQMVCAHCADGPEPPFDWSQAMGQYVGTLRSAIHRLKYHRRAALAEPLGLLLARSLDNPPTPLLPPLQEGRLAFDAVVPVPLHPSRQRQRGFNQAERLARVVARERGWPLDTEGLRRTRYTRSQTELSASERAVNILGAFAAKTPLYFEGKSVLLLDDVLTTLGTSRECARVLKNAGATRVCIVALARG